MNYTKSLCQDKLDLIESMIVNNKLNQEEINRIWNWLNDAAIWLDKYIDTKKVRER